MIAEADVEACDEDMSAGNVMEKEMGDSSGEVEKEGKRREMLDDGEYHKGLYKSIGDGS